MTQNQQKIYTAVNRLAKYFGLYTARDLSGRIAMEQLQGLTGNPSSSTADTSTFDLPPPPQEVVQLISDIIDTSEGAYTTIDLVRRLNESMTATQQSDSQGSDRSQTVSGRFNNLIDICAPQTHTLQGATNPITMDRVFVNSTINQNPNNPDKNVSPHLSVIKVNHVRVTPASKNINAVTLFLNSMPSLELARAIPYLDVQLVLPGSPVSQTGRLQNVSLFRFLEGNVEVDRDGSSSRTIMALGNKVQNTDFLEGEEPNEQNSSFTLTGMEIFTSPQTLTNGNESTGNPDRINPVLDKFQPLMSLKEFTVDVAPSTGLMSFKTGKLNFVLHDRSRLAEIADLVRPDLYARTELLIEYGWAHPENNSSSEAVVNYYGELINAMRVKEKYGIVNSSLSMDEAGQINIILDLAMRGGTDFSSETISTDETGNVNQILRTIRELSEAVGAYRRRIFGQNAGPSSTEVRGIQILDAAEDARSNIILDANLQTQLREFQRTLSRRASGSDGSEAARNLSNLLTQLYQSSGVSSPSGGRGSGGGGTSGRNDGGLVGSVRRSVQEAIRGKMARLAAGEDPFLRNDALANHPYLSRIQNGSLVARRRSSRGRDDTNTQRNIEQQLQGVPPNVSLAKLLLLFVGEPLAMTRKFDDIQFIFYPFNVGAGFARSLSVGSFSVDTRFFYENYSRLRLENLSRSSNMNLRDFLNFIARTIIDDHAARSYGLITGGTNGALFRRVSQDGGGSTTEATVDAVEMQNRVERLLTNVTPDASFRMPQVDFYMEALPQKIQREGVSSEDGNGKTILRIHVFDRHTTSYETQSSLIAATRSDEIRNINSAGDVEGGDEGVSESQTQTSREIISAASSAGFLERIPDSDMYRIRGGTATLKEFLKRTMPYVIYGAQGTTIKNANLTSIQDPQLSSVNMIRSFQSNGTEPNGEVPGGLPMQIIPCELSISMLGCPLVDYAQQFFIDFQTGTSIDNIYMVSGLSHRVAPGEFSSELKLSYGDAYGTYRSLLSRINNAALALREPERTAGVTPGGAGGSPSTSGT